MLRAKLAGTMRVWYGDVGDFVEADDIIAEIETADGAPIEIAAPAAGRITEIHALVGDTVESGTVLAHIDEAPQLLSDLLDGGQKPKRKTQRKSVVTPPRRYVLLMLSLLLMIVGSMAAMLLIVTPTIVVTLTTFATPVSRFYPGGYALLREPVGDLTPGTVLVEQAFYDGQTWQYTVFSGGITASVPESLLDGAPVPAPTPTMIYDYQKWGWANPLILAEPVADFPVGTRVRISSASFDGVAWQVDVVTEGGFSLQVRESQLALPPNPPANPLVTPTAAFMDSALWDSYSWVTIGQVGDIPANTPVRIISARYGFDGWIYTIVSKGDPTGVEALESQLAFASQAATPAP